MAYQLNLNWPEFLEKYWQKQPVVLKNAFPNFIDPITPDELAGLAMEPEVDSRLVSQKEGKWSASNGPFEHFDGLGETGWSLLAQAVNHWHLPAAELVKPFRVLPDWRLDDLMISFSVPGVDHIQRAHSHHRADEKARQQQREERVELQLNDG
jgi:50S ribosomal protein L16 3-hydroxylase